MEDLGEQEDLEVLVDKVVMVEHLVMEEVEPVEVEEALVEAVAARLRQKEPEAEEAVERVVLVDIKEIAEA